MLYHPALGGVSLVLLCAVTLVILYGRREARDLSIEESYAKYSWIGAFSQAKDKPASGSKDIEARDKYLEARNGHFRVFMQQTLLIYAIAVLGGPGIVAIGGYLLLKGQLTIGELVASEMIVGAIIFSLFKIPKILEQYYDYEASLDKVSSIYESHPLLERQSRRVFRRFGMGGTGLTRRVSFVFLSAAVSSPLALILPWVQTSGGYGRVYGYSPEERPQTISATISGRVREWYVNEGQQVEKGQVLARLEDLDPQAIDRLEEQRSAIEAQLKAVAVQRRVAINQFKRQTELARDGIVSTRALEVSETELAKVTQDEAQFLSKLSEMDLKISRQRAQTIVSPVTGFVSRVFRGRGGEILKQGEQLLLIVPRTSTKTAELWIDGRDAPLITIGQSARVQFEGWPAFQFSGWPELGIGTFAARVMMVDQSDENGKFRVILEDSQGTWPNSDVLRQGTRAYGMILLGQVTAGYELWRRMNGFPMLPPEDSLKNVINSRSIGSIASESEAPEGKNGKSGQQK
jgi:multidrug efflux pump subunit AcrA (membrane-fusion protein)